MTDYKKAITKAIRKVNPPKGQHWVSIEELLKAADKLDDSTNGRKH